MQTQFHRSGFDLIVIWPCVHLKCLNLLNDKLVPHRARKYRNNRLESITTVTRHICQKTQHPNVMNHGIAELQSKTMAYAFSHLALCIALLW